MLTFLVMLQLLTGTASDRAIPQTFRITGKVIAGRDEPVRTVVILKPLLGDGSRQVESFANGVFRFDGVTLGNWAIEVTDSRFNLYEQPLLLREAADTGKDLIVRLVRRGEENSPADALDIELYTLDAETVAKTPAKALEEFNKGVDAIRNRDKKNPADAHFRKAIAAAPGFYEAHVQLGLEQLRQNNKDDAAQSIERAAAIKTSEPRPMSLLGQVYNETQKFDKAVEVLSKLASIGKMSARDEYQLGLAFYRLDKLNESREHLAAAINQGNDADPAPFLQLHNVFMKMRSPLALDVLEDFLKLFPNDSNHAAMEDRAKQLRVMLKRPF